MRCHGRPWMRSTSRGRSGLASGGTARERDARVGAPVRTRNARTRRYGGAAGVVLSAADALVVLPHDTVTALWLVVAMSVIDSCCNCCVRIATRGIMRRRFERRVADAIFHQRVMKDLSAHALMPPALARGLSDGPGVVPGDSGATIDVSHASVGGGSFREHVAYIRARKLRVYAAGGGVLALTRSSDARCAGGAIFDAIAGGCASVSREHFAGTLSRGVDPDDAFNLFGVCVSARVPSRRPITPCAYSRLCWSVAGSNQVCQRPIRCRERSLCWESHAWPRSAGVSLQACRCGPAWTCHCAGSLYWGGCSAESCGCDCERARGG